MVLYRSGDASAVAARVGEALAARYGEGSVEFTACEAAPKNVDPAAVVIAIVGPRWLGRVIDGRPGIHHALDPVRSAVEKAMQGGAAVIPVTVAGSRLPREAELPDGLKAIASRPAIEVDGGRGFSSQMAQLIGAIDRHLPAQSGDDVEAVRPQPRADIPERGDGGATATDELVLPGKAHSAAAPLSGDRTTPEYWMHHVDVDRHFAPGDAPLIMVSYANEDLEWVNDLQAFIDPKLEHLRDPDGQPYRLWQFSDAQAGTALGDEFPSIIAEKMWRCRVAIVVLSKAYFTSRFCRQIELPLLMWRRKHHGLFCIPLRLGALPADRVRLPAYSEPTSFVFIDEIVDDRQAPAEFAASPHRDLNLKQLREKGLELEIESRFDGIAHLIVDFLRKQYAAVQD